MIKRMVTSAVFAGLAAGLLAALLHFAFVQKLILLGEQYETGVMVHFGGVVASGEAGHDHAAMTPEEMAAMAPDTTTAAAPEVGAAEAGHEHHKHVPAAEGEGGPRNALTSLFFGVVYVSYGLILAAGFGVAETFGKKITLREGLLWGLGGFVAFQLAPAMGLEPDLPGTMAADLAARQLWWWGTAIATIAGLGLIGYGKGLPAYGLAVLLIALPHIIGAPELDGYSGVAPPELASAFAARGLGVGLTVWAVLGALTGYFWSRSAPV
jgi:cobalt transporter subunit CbtA